MENLIEAKPRYRSSAETTLCTSVRGVSSWWPLPIVPAVFFGRSIINYRAPLPISQKRWSHLRFCHWAKAFIRLCSLRRYLSNKKKKTKKTTTLKERRKNSDDRCLNHNFFFLPFFVQSQISAYLSGQSYRRLLAPLFINALLSPPFRPKRRACGRSNRLSSYRVIDERVVPPLATSSSRATSLFPPLAKFLQLSSSRRPRSRLSKVQFDPISRARRRSSFCRWSGTEFSVARPRHRRPTRTVNFVVGRSGLRCSLLGRRRRPPMRLTQLSAQSAKRYRDRRCVSAIAADAANFSEESGRLFPRARQGTVCAPESWVERELRRCSGDLVISSAAWKFRNSWNTARLSFLVSLSRVEGISTERRRKTRWRFSSFLLSRLHDQWITRRSVVALAYRRSSALIDVPNRIELRRVRNRFALVRSRSSRLRGNRADSSLPSRFESRTVPENRGIANEYRSRGARLISLHWSLTIACSDELNA